MALEPVFCLTKIWKDFDTSKYVHWSHSLLRQMKRVPKTENHMGRNTFAYGKQMLRTVGVQKAEITLNLCDSESNSNSKIKIHTNNPMMETDVLFCIISQLHIDNTWRSVVRWFNKINGPAQLLTLGGASSEPPKSQDTGTCLLISIRLRSSSWAFSSARMVLHKHRWKPLFNNSILLLKLQPLRRSKYGS